MVDRQSLKLGMRRGWSASSCDADSDNDLQSAERPSAEAVTPVTHKKARTISEQLDNAENMPLQCAADSDPNAVPPQDEVCCVDDNELQALVTPRASISDVISPLCETPLRIPSLKSRRLRPLERNDSGNWMPDAEGVRVVPRFTKAASLDAGDALTPSTSRTSEFEACLTPDVSNQAQLPVAHRISRAAAPKRETAAPVVDEAETPKRRQRRNSSAPPVPQRLMRRRNAMILLVPAACVENDDGEREVTKRLSMILGADFMQRASFSKWRTSIDADDNANCIAEEVDTDDEDSRSWCASQNCENPAVSGLTIGISSLRIC